MKRHGSLSMAVNCQSHCRECLDLFQKRAPTGNAKQSALTPRKPCEFGCDGRSQAIATRVFGEGVKLARGATAILSAATTLEHVWNVPSHELLHTQNSGKNAIVLWPLRTIGSHELLHELLRQQITIAATPLAESTLSPNLFCLRCFLEKSPPVAWLWTQTGCCKLNLGDAHETFIDHRQFRSSQLRLF